jgi:hypothetical protein
MVGYSALSQRNEALAEKIVPARQFRASFELKIDNFSSELVIRARATKNACVCHSVIVNYNTI